MFSRKNPSLLDPYDIISDVINEITSTPKIYILAGAFGSMIYNAARFQRVYISLLVECALILR